jgi:hypothetical protein
MSDTLNKVKEVIADVLKVDTENITPETRFIEDLKADSMDQFFLIDGLLRKVRHRHLGRRSAGHPDRAGRSGVYRDQALAYRRSQNSPGF